MASQPWERLDKESPVAWEAFCVYRDMGAQRSTAKCAQQVSKPKQMMDRWSGRNHWVARAAAWDAECDNRRRTAHLKAIDKMAQRHVGLAQRLVRKARERLDSMSALQMEPEHVAAYIALGVKIERQARGVDFNRIELTGKDGGAIEVDQAYLAKLDDKQLYALAKQAVLAYEDGTTSDEEQGADSERAGED